MASCVSTAGGNYLEILARHGQRSASALIEALQKFRQIASQAGQARRVERGEGLQHRPVVRAEHFQPVRGEQCIAHPDSRSHAVIVLLLVCTLLVDLFSSIPTVWQRDRPGYNEPYCNIIWM